MKEKFLQIWKDPVGSKIIATGLTGALAFLGLATMSLLQKISFFAILKATILTKIDLWIVLVLIVFAIFLPTFIKLFQIKNKEPYTDF